MKYIIPFLLVTSQFVQAQRVGTNPFVFLDGKFSIQYEYPTNHPLTSLIGGVRYYSPNYGIYSGYFAVPVELQKINDFELEQGVKRYVFSTISRRTLFIGVLGNVAYSSLRLKEAFFVSPDSISAKGFVLSPEIRAGLDLPLFRGRVVIQPIAGIRRRFSLMNFDKLTHHDGFWSIGPRLPGGGSYSRAEVTQIRNRPMLIIGINLFVDLSRRQSL